MNTIQIKKLTTSERKELFAYMSKSIGGIFSNDLRLMSDVITVQAKALFDENGERKTDMHRESLWDVEVSSNYHNEHSLRGYMPESYR